jgi:hypothetical protein
MSNEKLDKSFIEELRKLMGHVQEMIDELEKPNPKQWEPRSGEFTIHGDGGVFLTGPHNTSPSYISAGMVRKTKEAADKASADMRSHNRLLAYVYEFGGDWVADWSDTYQNKYAVCYNNASNTWDCISVQYAGSIGTVYMSRQCAEGLIAKLKTGEVTL